MENPNNVSKIMVASALYSVVEGWNWTLLYPFAKLVCTDGHGHEVFYLFTQTYGKFYSWSIITRQNNKNGLFK